MPHTAVDLIAVSLFTGVMAVLLYIYREERTRLEGELERNERQNQIGRVLLTDRNLRGVTRHVAESAARLLGSDLAHVTLVVGGEGRLVVDAATGPLAATVGAAVPLEGSMAGWVVRRAQPLVLNDPDSGDQSFRALHERIPLRRSVMLPLIARGRCVGALGVDNPRDGRPFGPRDVALLRDLADYAALAIEAIQAAEELGERERRAAQLNQITSRIRQSLDLQQILDTAVRELGEALAVSRCYIRLRRGADLLPPDAEWQASDAPRPSLASDPAAPLLLAALRERRIVETPDVREIAAITTASPGLRGPLAVLAAPVVLREEVIGVIAFHQLGLSRLWRPGDIALVEAVAADLAIAVSNARLYRSVDEASRELVSKIGELERANRMKAQFLANMSHELRTPLNSVIGFSEILLAGEGASLTAEQHDALETIARNGRHLLDLVNDVLDLSKVEAGRMELRLMPLDLHALVPGVLAEVESLRQARGHHVKVELGDAPLTIVADATRARQVLFNLLSNAIKFTPPGGEIVIHAARRRSLLQVGPRQGERDTVWLSVSDTGIGIGPDDLPKLFSEFTQIDATYARHYEGTGLGLALCKRFMDLHGGRIGVESVRGRGSTFWVEFPVEGPQIAAA